MRGHSRTEIHQAGIAVHPTAGAEAAEAAEELHTGMTRRTVIDPRSEQDLVVFDSAMESSRAPRSNLRFLRGREAAICGICVRLWLRRDASTRP
jgi:hypothetical protein